MQASLFGVMKLQVLDQDQLGDALLGGVGQRKN